MEIKATVEQAKELGGFVRVSNERFGWVYYPHPDAAWPKSPHLVTDPATIDSLEEAESGE